MGLKKVVQTQFEKAFVKAMRWGHIPGSYNNFIYLDIKRYKGDDIEVDGELIVRGDLVAELHIDNINVANLEDSIGGLIRGYNEEFKSLAYACNNETGLEGIKGFYCTTLLHPFIKRMGFTCFPLKSKLSRKLLKVYQAQLKNTFGKKQDSRKREIEPMKCWITSQALKIKYEVSLK